MEVPPTVTGDLKNLGAADRNGRAVKMDHATKGLQKALVAERRRRQAAETEAFIRKAYAMYRSSDSIESDIVSATRAGFANSGCVLELLEGSFRVLQSGQIGNLYDSPGFMIPLPELGDGEWDDEEENHFFDAAVEELDDAIEELIREQYSHIIRGDHERPRG